MIGPTSMLVVLNAQADATGLTAAICLVAVLVVAVVIGILEWLSRRK